MRVECGGLRVAGGTRESPLRPFWRAQGLFLSTKVWSFGVSCRNAQVHHFAAMAAPARLRRRGRALLCSLLIGRGALTITAKKPVTVSPRFILLPRATFSRS